MTTIFITYLTDREAMGEDPNAKKKEDKEEQSKSRKQIEESRQVSLNAM